ncbi:hypothetical protein [Sinanaerobacter chloroacetimidivorans]|jgi:hypothetical protein|uniref:Uncharacterized protein n=1 Tax=Sinanaerobacter chloroacetimidivorans TaxID=2818044 RepID=A0A8J8B3X8_9FIRM|nr:hypothetical protein [Sinanaerobacter chloroacetimidivorans]MBR0598780.1 hypothetical protein [Sinanaerobacter chloroacetimidivorans]
MSKISVVLYYWIAVAAALLFARTAGIADNDAAIIKILIVVTIAYIGLVMIFHSRAKSVTENQSGQKKNRSQQTNHQKKKK